MKNILNTVPRYLNTPPFATLKYSTKFLAVACTKHIQSFQLSTKCRDRFKPSKHHHQISAGSPKNIYARDFTSEKNVELGDHSKLKSPSKDHVFCADTPRRTAKYSSYSGRRKRYKLLFLASVSLSCVMGVMLQDYMQGQKTEFVLNETSFTPFKVLKKEPISSTAFILTLCPFETQRHSTTSDPYKRCWKQGIWSVEVKQPELQIARSYTPLHPLPGQPLGNLRFLIRKEHRGEVSGYLDRLPLGSIIQLRGPHQEFQIPDSVSEVLFLAGGTGIAPALQVAYTLLEKRETREAHPLIHIIWANRRREDCWNGAAVKINPDTGINENAHPIVEELERLQKNHSSCFNVEYLVDEEGAFLTRNKLPEVIQEESNPTDTLQSQRILFVSGPEGFVNAIAGPKRWENGIQVQGDVGGLLRGLKLESWKVWKL